MFHRMEIAESIYEDIVEPSYKKPTLIDLNEYSESFPGATLNDKIGLTKLNHILLNSMSNICYIQPYLQGFDCEYITFNNAVNMFHRMEIAESIYEDLVEPSYKKPTWEDSNCAGHSRQKREEVASSRTHPEEGESAGKHRKRYVEIPTGKSKTCLIHGPVHYSEECKVLGAFKTKYPKIIPNKDHGNSPVPRKS